MGNTGGTGDLRPGAAGDAAAFVGLMQQLKEHSGLTYRQLERRAAEGGAVLARSTLADALRRNALPRAETVEAFVRACGGTEAEAGEWLAARRRIAAGTRTAPAQTPAPAPDHAPSQRPYRKRPKRITLIVAAALAAVLAAVGVRLLVGKEAPAVASPPAGEVRIHPLRAPALCLTDGRVLRAHRYRTVAVQRPCTEAVPPHTRLKAAGAGYYRIQWDHPDEGTGCLVLLHEPALDGLLEPHDDCSTAGPAQRFRIEPAGKAAYRFRTGDGVDRCLAVEGGRAAADGAVARAEPCTGADGEKFLIDGK
ncbi:XRE family transcriptional regulator [Streptomyces sp. NPDC101227]|uniref:XRE family transcriptional regulator n=1 Tax=Streptomyces sp. NPDC101227 TaxID=3366136 RepID=UPI0038122A65